MAKKEQKQATALSALLQETRKFKPPADFTKQANVNDPAVFDAAAKDPESFWAGFAEKLQWDRKWDKVLDWQPPNAKWFVGGKLNACVNCVDRHVQNGMRNKAAIIWEGEPGEQRTLTYWDLYREVNKFGNVLRSLGVAKGDR